MGNSADVIDISRRLPTEEEVLSASEAATALARVRDTNGALSINDGAGGQVRLAPTLADLIIALFGHISRGDMVKLVPIGAMLTTQQAADLLNVSRPFLTKLLTDEVIPHIPVGSHRRVMLVDLMKYMEMRNAKRNDALERLANLGQEYDAL